MGFIETQLIGVLQEDPKFFEGANYALCSLRVQVDELKMVKGEKRTFSSWHTVKVFGQQSALCQGWTKGDQIFAKGTPRRNKYTGKDGMEKVTWEIAANQIQRLSDSGEQAVDLGSPSNQNQDGQEYVPF